MAHDLTGEEPHACGVCGAALEWWRPRSQKYCSDACRATAAKKRRGTRPAGGGSTARRAKPELTPGTPPVPDPARTRTVHGDPYWAPLLSAAERAVGGEPCRICADPIPARAPWAYRDRHVCSERCNTTLKRRTRARIRRGEIDVATVPELASRYAEKQEQRLHFGQARQPRVFRTRDADADFPYEFHGFRPIPGDVVERNGSLTRYATAAGVGAEDIVALVRANSDGDVEPMIALHEQTGSWLAYTTGIRWWTEVPGQVDDPSPALSFEAPDGQSWSWHHEVIRDVDEDGRAYDWEAWVCVTEPLPVLWTPAYAARSAKRIRVTRARNSYQARMRDQGVLNAAADDVDPRDVYERDGWLCRLCHRAIDPILAWPNVWSATLDHIRPVARGGEHIPENLQSAHWICNVRKGDAWGPGDTHPVQAGEEAQ